MAVWLEIFAVSIMMYSEVYFMRFPSRLSVFKKFTCYELLDILNILSLFLV